MAVMRWLVRQRQQRYSICPKFIVVLFLASNFGCIFVDSSPRSRLLASNSNSTTRPYHQLVNDNYDDPEANKSSSIVEQQQRYYDEAIQVSSLEKYYCYDYRTDCYHRANVNSECITNPKWMHSHCPISCNVSCSEHIVQTVPIELSLHSNKTRKRTTIVDAVGNDLGMVPQIVPSNYLTDDTVYEKIDTILSNARTYMSKIQTQEKYQIVRSLCSNRNDTCIQLALDGKCEDDDESDDNDDIYNSTIMSRMCGPICQSCEELHVSLKCPLPHANEIRNAFYPGDLNRMFERIINDPKITNQYNVTILSRPFNNSNESDDVDDHDIDDNPDDAGDNSDSQNNTYNLGVVNGPWVLILDNFLNETEVKRMILLGKSAGYARSTDVGDVLENGEFGEIVSHDRTSTNAWCNTDECNDDIIANTIYERIESLTGVPVANYEPFQLLRYEYKQFYAIHHDYIEEEYERIQGVRVLTVFLYLNNITEGGGTNFPFLNNKDKGKQQNITIQPVLGRAVIWPSVLNNSPHKIDRRTFHEALPVLGEHEIKYGANVWIHQREIVDECKRETHGVDACRPSNLNRENQ